MSWQAYVDTNLVGSGKLAKAAIIGLDGGGSIWAASSGYQLSPSEIQSLLQAFQDPSKIRSGGLFIAGVKVGSLGHSVPSRG